MKNYNLEQIKQRVLEWYQMKHSRLENDRKYKMELLKNEEAVIFIEISFENCFASILVDSPYCAPYKHIFFQADAFDSEEALKPGGEEMVYFFYDSPEDDLDEVIKGLDYSFELCLNYEPDKLRQEFINKKGRIETHGKRVERFIHSSDLTKIQNGLWDDEFTCKEVQFQHLIVENKLGDSLRVLPEHYEINEASSNSSKKQGLFSKLFEK